MSADALRDALRRLAAGESLTADEAASAFGVVMRGDATAAQTAALLMGLRVKGETAEELTGAARALRTAMVRLPAREPELLLDTCGTGGGRVQTFNIKPSSFSRPTNPPGSPKVFSIGAGGSAPPAAMWGSDFGLPRRCSAAAASSTKRTSAARW